MAESACGRLPFAILDVCVMEVAQSVNSSLGLTEGTKEAA